MPVASLPVQQPHNIISLGLDCRDQARFVLTLAAALVGPIALLLLVVLFSKKYKITILPVPGEWPYLLKQSRGPTTGRVIMSVSRKSDIPSFGSRGTLEEGSFDGHDLSQTPSSKPKRQEEPRTLITDADELRNLHARPPSPMPLTPPILSTPFLSLQDRRLSVAASTHGDFDPTLARGANSDVSSSGGTTLMVPNVKASSPIPLRTSYTKMGPFDSLHSEYSTAAEMEDASSAFAPSSFPSSNPILPIAPHAALEPRDSEIVSVMDDSGAGWKRHTRVYGGGVCLACLGSDGNHGGFYGENVPLDQRR
ncbi:hypothetical protein F4802DRAFT_352715 [Xylaria palmicola]|nr:hypothetical protein F4802DRAFT_352715 [Xylaria palmicola]